MESLRLDSGVGVAVPPEGTPGGRPELLFRLCLELAPSLRSVESSPRFGEFVRDLLEAFEAFEPEFVDEDRLE